VLPMCYPAIFNTRNKEAQEAHNPLRFSLLRGAGDGTRTRNRLITKLTEGCFCISSHVCKVRFCWGFSISLSLRFPPFSPMLLTICLLVSRVVERGTG